VSRHNPRADRLNQLKRKRIPRSGPHLPVTDNLGSQEYKIKKEIAVMKLCRHPHVVRLLEVIDDKLYQKVYMGEFVPVLLLSLCPFFVLCAGFCAIQCVSTG
jgi:[calcium/calmodulin-dependent protein kinase] kinase